MSKVAFHFEETSMDVCSGTADFADAWRLIGKTYGITYFAIIRQPGLGDVPKFTDTEVVCNLYDTIEDFEAAETGTKIYLTPPGTQPAGDNYVTLSDYSHDHEWMVFGPSQGWDAKSGVDWLGVQWVTEIHLHAVQIVPIVLWRRARYLNLLGT